MTAADAVDLLLSVFGDIAMWLAAGICVKTVTGGNAAAGLTFFA